MVRSIGHCGRVRCEPGWSLGPDWSRGLKDYNLWFIHAGRGSMQLTGGRALTLRPGVGLWMRPGNRYIAEQQLPRQLGVNYIHFTRGGGVPTGPETFEVRDVGYVDTLMSRIVELHQSDHGTAARALLKGLLLDIAEGACTRPAGPSGTARHHEDVAHAAAARIREHVGEPVDVAALARSAGYAADHFTRVFREVIGVPPQVYAIEQRIARARTLLDESSMTVSQIAGALGYETVNFFCRQFRKQTGVSPGRYRSF